MKFEHKKVDIKEIGSSWLTLVPRKDFTEQKSIDLACKAIVSDIRDNYYFFLKRPYSNELSDFLFYQGASVLVIVNKIKNEVYFFERYQEDIDEEFKEIFFNLTNAQRIYRIFTKLNFKKLLEKNFKGTGNIKRLEKAIRNIEFQTNIDSTFWKLNSELSTFLDLNNELITFFNRKDKSEFEQGEWEVSYALFNDNIEHIYFQIVKSYYTICEIGISGLLELNNNYQKEEWSEWEEALKDWREFYNLNQIKYDSEEINRHYGSNKYLSDFRNQCKVRKITTDYESEVLQNTVSRIIEDISNREGVNVETVERSLKKTFNIRKKDELYSILINDTIRRFKQ